MWIIETETENFIEENKQLQLFYENEHNKLQA